MQPIKYLHQWLLQNANEQHYLFTSYHLRPLYPELSELAFKAVLNRAVRSKILVRVCRGLYLYEKAMLRDGLLLFHIAATLRANAFNYISLETVLSDAGVISQIPINRIFLMSSGRSNVISCGSFGTIEFVHTNRKPDQLVDQLIYDQDCGMWRANVALALRDMRMTRRSMDLIDWDVANEFI